MYRDVTEEVIVEEIKTAEELSARLKPLYIIHDYMQSNESYKRFLYELLNYMRGCYNHKECREYPVTFKFYVRDTETHTMQFRHFLINACCWYPFINLKDVDGVLNSEFILDCFTQIPRLNGYLNKIILKLNEYTVKTVTSNISISELLHNLRTIIIDFSQVLNLNINLSTFMQPYLENERVREIMNTQINYGMQPSEIEKLIADLTKEEVGIYIREFPNNPVSIMLKTGTGIKTKQFGEFTVAGGLKPSLDGNTLPVPISHSYLIGGTAKPSEHYIDSIASRKSLVMNKKEMGKAGKKLPALNPFNCWELLVA